MKKQLLLVPALCIAAAGALKAQTVIYSQDFESTTGSAIPATWTQTTQATDGGWLSGTNLGSSSFGIPAHTRYVATNDDGCNCNKSNDFLVSASFALTSAMNPKLTFDVLNPAGTYQGATEKMTVEVSTNGGSTWTVLETVPSIVAWTNHAIDLTPYAGQGNVMVGFRYNDGGGWLFGAAIDNVKVIEPAAKEVSVTSVIMNKYVLAGNQTVSATLLSNGGPNVTSAILNYNVDGGTAVQQTFSPALSFGNTYTANFTTPANLTAGLHTVKAWVSDVNGTGPDATPNNDTASFYVTVQASKPAKKVLIEEFTGAWCGYCPRGGVALHDMTAADPDVIGAAIHDNSGSGGDQMITTEGNTVISAYASAFPTGMVDRAFYGPENDYTLDNSEWQDLVDTRKAEVVPATVTLTNVSYNTTSRQISVTVSANFVADVKGAYSLNCYVVENNIYGPLGTNASNGWNQHSYYYGDNTSPFYQIGYLPTPGDQSLAYLRPNEYTHNHVVDKMMGGPYGDNTVIPSSSMVTAGTTFTKTFTYTLPAADPGGAHRYHPENVYLVGMVAEYSASNKAARYILNVTQSKLVAGAEDPGPVSVNEVKGDFGTVSVYPNPASTLTNISLDLKTAENIKITVYDALGQVVRSEEHSNLDAGVHVFDMNTAGFNSGIYNVVISTNKGSITKKVTIAK